MSLLWLIPDPIRKVMRQLVEQYLHLVDAHWNVFRFLVRSAVVRSSAVEFNFQSFIDRFR